MQPWTYPFTHIHCRMDLFFTEYSFLPFALVGWIGSKQLGRLMRKHAAACGMHNNNSGLVLNNTVPRQQGQHHASDKPASDACTFCVPTQDLSAHRLPVEACTRGSATHGPQWAGATAARVAS